MKKLIQESFRSVLANRYLLVLSSVLVVLAVTFAIFVGLSVHPSELQQVSHCSAFGVTHLYRDQWFYLLLFGVFGLFVAILHVILAAKLLLIKGPQIALLFIWLGIAIIIMAWVTTYPVLNIFSVGDCRALIGR